MLSLISKETITPIIINRERTFSAIDGLSDAFGVPGEGDDHNNAHAKWKKRRGGGGLSRYCESSSS